MSRFIKWSLLAVAVAFAANMARAQFRGGGGFWREESGPMVRTEGGQLVNQDTVSTARETFATMGTAGNVRERTKITSTCSQRSALTRWQ